MQGLGFTIPVANMVQDSNPFGALFGPLCLFAARGSSDLGLGLMGNFGFRPWK